MAPEIVVRNALGDPVLVHKSEEVELSEGSEEGTYAGAVVGRDRVATRGTGGGVRGWEWIVLAAKQTLIQLENEWTRGGGSRQIAVLRI